MCYLWVLCDTLSVKNNVAKPSKTGLNPEKTSLRFKKIKKNG